MSESYGGAREGKFGTTPANWGRWTRWEWLVCPPTPTKKINQQPGGRVSEGVHITLL
jgi:hypothetical protein